ncbi:MAG: LptF/LptG family permease [Bacteroidia bacterium]
MKRIDRFILRSYLGPFILTFFISLFILLMQFVWKYVDDLVGKGLEFFIIGKLLFLVSITMISLALPLAVLLSSLMAYGNLGEYMELTAMKASGISLQRAIRPVFIFCLFLSISAFYFSNNILPIANLKMKTLLQDISNKRPELNIKPGIFNSDIQNYVIRIGRKSSDGKNLSDIMIYDHSNRNGNDRVIIAEKGTMGLSADGKFLELRMINGHSYTEAEPGRRKSGRYPFLRENFREELIRFDLSVFEMTKTDESLYKRNYQMLNLKQLELSADTLRAALQKEQSYLPGVLFHGPFFDSTKTYSTVWKEPVKPGKPIVAKEEEEVIPDSIAMSDSAYKYSSFNDSVLANMDTSDPNIMRLITRVKLSRLAQEQELEQSRQESGKLNKKKLRSELHVLENFNTSQKIRIYESAMNNLRSNKSTVDYSMQNFDQDQERINRHDIEWHRKFTLSFACMILLLIGAPLGAIVRKGGLGMPVIFSLVFFILYHMISITGEKLAREGVLTPFWGMWLSSSVLLPMGLFLSYKATTDSALFDRDAYLKFFRRIFGKLKKPAAKQ